MTKPYTSAILLAGGVGSRMNSPLPKQYLTLQGKAIIHYSFELFLSHPDITEVVVVCHPDYQHLFEEQHHSKPVSFALPGKRRQDSVYHGLQATSPAADLVCIHDGARPLVTDDIVDRVLAAGLEYGATTAAVPVSSTIKQTDDNGFVETTVDRSHLWDIQTPQAIKTDFLRLGFLRTHEEDITVTDDVALVELLGHPVKLVEGHPSNIKVTTPTDLAIAEALLSSKTPAHS